MQNMLLLECATFILCNQATGYRQVCNPPLNIYGIALTRIYGCNSSVSDNCLCCWTLWNTDEWGGVNKAWYHITSLDWVIKCHYLYESHEKVLWMSLRSLSTPRLSCNGSSCSIALGINILRLFPWLLSGGKTLPLTQSVCCMVDVMPAWPT